MITCAQLAVSLEQLEQHSEDSLLAAGGRTDQLVHY